MRKLLAALVVLAALLITAPAGAESICIHENNCHGIPGPAGGGMTNNFTVKLRLFGGEVLGSTGFDVYNVSANDARGQICVDGACSGVMGVTLISDPNKCGENNCLLVNTGTQCYQFSRHEPLGSACHDHV